VARHAAVSDGRDPRRVPIRLASRAHGDPEGPERPLSGCGASRRAFLKAGTLGAVGLSLSRYLALRAATGAAPARSLPCAVASGVGVAAGEGADRRISAHRRRTRTAILLLHAAGVVFWAAQAISGAADDGV
jgi:hypothetical protein